MKMPLFLLMVCFSTFVLAEDNSVMMLTNQIENLEKHVDTLEIINSKLLSSVYWTIGSFSLLVFAFMAVNIIAGIQTKKKELENISNDLENKIKVIFAEKSESFDKKINDYNTETNKKIESKISALKLSQESTLSKLKSDILEHRKEYLEYYNTKEKDAWNVLMNILEIIRIDVEVGFSYRVDDSLDKLYAYVNEKEIDFDDANRIQETLSRLDERFSLRKDNINKNIRIRKKI
jgi:hypothetical protein